MTAAKFKIALCQFLVSNNKSANLKKITDLVKEATSKGANIVVLPECCNSPFGHEYFPTYAEEIPKDESTSTFSKAALDNKIYLIAGTIPEKRDGKLYNTLTCFNPQGELINKYSKVHLFDINVPGKIEFQESKSLTAGSQFSFVETPYCRIGLGVCYDIRFQEMAQIYRQQGCKLLVYPAAFNMTTGPAHWELLARARSLDNQSFVAIASPARDTKASYVAYGHSLVSDPWGKVIASTKEKEEIIYADIDLNYLEEVRQMIPITNQKRDDLYVTSSLKDTPGISTE